jgi:predicted CoA-substrate-specific enzyme activase
MVRVAQRGAVVGLKVGRTTVAAVLLEESPDGSWKKIGEQCVAHQRNPRAAVGHIWARLDHSRVRTVVATGSFAGVLGPPVQRNIPRDAAVVEACGHFFPQRDDGRYEPITLIRISAGGYSIETRNQQGEFQHSPAEKCSAGTGDAIEKLCARAGLSVAEALELAESADDTVDFAPRCAAFAQSEFTHLAQTGMDKAVLLRSYFRSIAGFVAALFQKHALPGRVVVIGGVTKNRLVMLALEELLGREIEIHPAADTFEAWGAALIAVRLAKRGMVASFEADPATIIQPRERTTRSFRPLEEYRDRVIQMEEPEYDTAGWRGRAILGIDSGSTGTKAALVDLNTQQRVWDGYVPTGSDPVAAAQTIVQQMITNVGDRATVVGIGVTGSGRGAVYDVVVAAFPELLSRVMVETEISAHARGACYYDPDRGRSLTIGEFGGQDVKVINVLCGFPASSDMNKACSAGTSSEVEYDANRLGITIQEFGARALVAREPIDMGQTCVVFSVENADRALSEGYTVEDLCAGRYYFIATNWLNRLVGQMGLGEKIVVLGMPVNNIALPLAVAAVTGRTVIVPPRPGATGAIGIALLTLEDCIQQELTLDQEFSLGRFLAARVDRRSTFVCGNRECGSRCHIHQTRVVVGDHAVSVKAGGMCPMHERGSRTKLPAEAPKPFQERQRFQQAFIDSLPRDIPGEPIVALPVTLANVRFLPLLGTFFAELGVNVRAVEPTSETFRIGEQVCTGKDMCAPVKIAHGVVAQAVETGATHLCFPKIVLMPQVNERDVGSTCPLIQGAPEMVDTAMNGVRLRGLRQERIRVLKPILQFRREWERDQTIRSAFAEMARTLGRDRQTASRAFDRAVEAWHGFQSRCREIGTTALEYAEREGVPAVVVLGRPYVLHSVINGRIPEIIQGGGAIAIPVDCYPIKPETPVLDQVFWGEGQRNLRTVIDLLGRPNAYPLWVTCYACGPDAFLEHWLRYLANVPYCVIETDGHTGMAGFATRIQSALYAMRWHLSTGDKRGNMPDLSVLQRLDSSNPYDPDAAVVVCQFGNTTPLLAAAYESAGINVIQAPATNDEILRLGRRFATGKECVPYMYVTGVLRYMVENVLPRLQHRFKTFYWWMAHTTGPCRYGAYRTQHVIHLQAHDPNNTIRLFSPSSDNAYDGLGKHVRLKCLSSIAMADALDELRCYWLPIARDVSRVEAAMQRAMKSSADTIRRGRVANGFFGQARDWFRVWGLVPVLREAIRDFRTLPVDPQRARRVKTINLTGEIYVVRDDHANGDVVGRLARHGIRVRRSKVSTWIQYLTWTQGHGHKRHRFNRWSVKIKALIQWWVLWRLDRLVAAAVGRTTHTRVEPLIDKAGPYFESAPEGEAVLTIAESLSGSVVVGPQGCMPSKFAEAQLHHAPGAKVHFRYVDGDPPDDAALASFAYSLYEDGIDSLSTQDNSVLS